MDNLDQLIEMKKKINKLKIDLDKKKNKGDEAVGGSNNFNACL
jgi:hypothetical protein